MGEIDNYVVLDKKAVQEKINKLKLLRKKAMEEQTFEIAQWLEGKIDCLKTLTMDSIPLEPIMTEAFDKGWEKCGEYNSNYKDCLTKFLQEFSIQETNEN